MQKILNQYERNKYCTNLNYILDLVVQALKNFNKSNEFFYLIHLFEENSKDVLNNYPILNCPRDLHKSEDKNLYIKKIMYDLYEDIEYMRLAEEIIGFKQCSKMVNRIKNRWEILTEIYAAVNDEKIFNLDEEYTFPNINKMFKALRCTKTTKLPKSMTVTRPKPLTEPQPLTAPQPATEQQSVTKPPSPEEDLLKSRGTEDEEEPIDLKDLEINLPVNEDPPKLDTTYAAASLAGVSLFGTILYKVNIIA
ncbi:hypothetical protein PVIIG_05677 [Plasmodium vivax India VII]|uniref:Uncharacterized protein n=1 Tax=Plasmodium vivax India VII TaxID=1077284 RepID=A0A0J9S267_PLAVI|nr:hypothetical protein PVIIG_05677 [Plasmodium vivax India VII]